MPEKPDNGQHSNGADVKIGVYTCYCGGNISDVVDCEKVAETLGHLPNVVVSRTDMSMCSDAGQAMLEDDIREHGVNRVVIGACAPMLHEQTFRGAVARAGLNPYLYHHVGIREQASWVHHDDPNGATDKAIRMMSAGIAKARHLKELNPIQLGAEKHALVIGGGLAGLKSALNIAQRGIKVTLIEKTPFLGGHMTQIEGAFPLGGPARGCLHPLIEEVLAHPLTTVYTQTEVVSVKGYVGDFQVQLRQHSRGVTDDMAEAAMEACVVEVPDEFNYGLTNRKLVYRAYEGCYPATPAVDWANCSDGKLELELNGQTVMLQDEPQTIDLTVGAAVIATGFKLYEPPQGEFGYGERPEVITLAQLIRLMALQSGEESLTWQGHAVRSMAVIHCVGSRQHEGLHEPQADGQVNNYCSRICCTATLHTLNDLKEQYPDIHVFDLYQDIRTYGRGHEEYYIDASKRMVRFLRYHEDEIPVVGVAPAGDAYPVLVNVKDSLTQGMELEVPVDLVVLATGMMPNPVDDLIDMFKISAGTDRFLLEVHPKLRPVETAMTGVVLAGTAQGPMNLQESSAAASAAAAKVAGLLSQGKVELDPFVAAVDLDRCDGTGACVEVCTYEDAIALETILVHGEMLKRAVVTPANCAGCGNCVSACPNHAIDVQGWTMDQYESMLDAIAADLPVLEGAL